MFYRRSRRHGDFDHILYRWSDVDPFTVRHATQNVAIFGKSGSGKSSGSGNALIRALVRYWNTGGLWLASKPEDLAYARRVFKEAGRLDDLLVMEPGGRYRFNLLAYEQKRGNDARQLTQLLMLLAETLDRMEGGSSQGGEPMWKAKNREGLDHAIEIVTRATGKLDPWALQCFITGAALSPAELEDEQWQQSFHHQALELAEKNAVTDTEKHDHQAAREHWTSAWPRMNDRTRTSIEAGILSILHVFNTGKVRDLLATTTTISPDMLEGRKWWFVNCPIVPGDAVSTFLNTAAKLSVQRYILGREAGASDPLLCIVCDEFTKVANSYDSHALNEIRSHKGMMLNLTQGISGLYAHMGKGGEHMADALMSQYGHIVIHTADPITARFGSEALGHRLELKHGGNPRQPEDSYDLVAGRSMFMPNFSYNYEPVLQPLAFMSGLRSGGPDNDNTVDGIVIRPGVKFKHSDENYMLVSFKQG